MNKRTNKDCWNAQYTRTELAPSVTQHTLKLTCGRRIHRFTAFDTNTLKQELQTWTQFIQQLGINAINNKGENHEH